MDIGISDIGLSSHISNHISIENGTDGQKVQVTVYFNDISIYTTVIYMVGTTAHLYDIGVLVNDYMRNEALSWGKFKVYASFSSKVDQSEVYVVYANISTTYQDDKAFLTNNYLTNRSCYVIPRGKEIPVSMFSDASENVSGGTINFIYRKTDGSISSTHVAHFITNQHTAAMYTFYISEAEMKVHLKKAFPKDMPTILGGSIIHGNRCVEFYFVEEQPIGFFDFLNAFNVWERYYVYGTEALKTEVTQKEAFSSGVASYYNQSFEQKRKVETVPLTIDEGLWLNEFLYSPKIMKPISADISSTVLLSDISSEVSDSPKEQNIIKFSWKYSEPINWRVYDDSLRIFSNEYSKPFA